MDKPIRIAHVIGKLNAGGVESVVSNYYRYMNHERYQFDFIIDDDSQFLPKQELLDLGARYYSVPPYQRLIKHIRKMVELFQKNRYLVVHSGMNTLAVFSLYAAWKAGVPVRINHNHSTASKGETKKNLFKYLLRPFAKCFATDLCACSKYAGEWLFGEKSVRNEQVTIINNAIDLKHFKYDEETRRSYRSALGLENAFVIGHVGRFCYQKNHSKLLDIFKEIHSRKPEAILLLIGTGELEEYIMNKVKKYNLEESVVFLGARGDVNSLYQAMDIFVLPSRYEGLPVVGVEAQATGLPCVFSTSMTKEVCINRNVEMVSLNEPADKWAEIVCAMENCEREVDQSLLASSGFDIVSNAKKLEEYYDNLISKAISKTIS